MEIKPITITLLNLPKYAMKVFKAVQDKKWSNMSSTMQ